MNRKIFFTIILGFALFELTLGMQSVGVIYDDDAITITIGKENYQERINLSQLFDSVKYIILDNSDNCLIGEISKIVYYDNRFYVLDVQQMIIFVFSDTGEMIFKIDKRGQGPGEYRYLTDFDVRDNRIVIFDRFNQLLEYDLNGNFVKKNPVSIPGRSFIINGDYYYFYTCNLPSFFGDYSLLITDKEVYNLKNGIRIPQNNILYKCINLYHSNAFYRFENKIRYYTPFETKVYSIENDGNYSPPPFFFK